MKRRELIKTGVGSVLGAIGGKAKAATVAPDPAPASPPVTEISQPGPQAKREAGLALALGGGAAKGFAHIPYLECLDELGVRPQQVVGTSMGAILGSLYCSGMSGLEIRAYTLDLFSKRQPLLKKLLLDTGQTWGSLFNFIAPAVIDPVVLLKAVLPGSLPDRFGELQIPLKVVATNFHRQSAVLLEEGDLLSAVAASSALPVLLTPVRREGMLLIDGGFVNPTPFDLLDRDQYLTVGIDVTGGASVDDGTTPGSLAVWMGSFSITLHSIVEAKLVSSHPDLLVSPPIDRFKTMEFFKVKDILEAADQGREHFKRNLERLLDRN